MNARTLKNDSSHVASDQTSKRTTWSFSWDCFSSRTHLFSVYDMNECFALVFSWYIVWMHPVHRMIPTLLFLLLISQGISKYSPFSSESQKFIKLWSWKVRPNFGNLSLKFELDLHSMIINVIKSPYYSYLFF